MRVENDRLMVPEHVFPIRHFTGVKKYRSVWRAMRRGLASQNGEALPTRPFNNSKRTKGRKLQKDFQQASEQYKHILAKARKIDTENAKKH